MKPILKIETPSSFQKEEFEAMNESLKDSQVAKEYHIIVVIGTTDYFNLEIITAANIGLHLNQTDQILEKQRMNVGNYESALKKKI